jgi:hypothetical protein
MEYKSDPQDDFDYICKDVETKLVEHSVFDDSHYDLLE